MLGGAYNFLDLAPKARDQDALPWSLAWVNTAAVVLREHELRPKGGGDDPMSVPVTALYAAIFALWLTALAVNVTVHRVKLRVSVGDGGNPVMLRMMRLHANAVEYLPIALILMGAYELNGGRHLVLHIAGIAMILARLSHALALWRSAAAGPARRFGQGTTWVVIAALAIANLWKLV